MRWNTRILSFQEEEEIDALLTSKIREALGPIRRFRLVTSQETIEGIRDVLVGEWPFIYLDWNNEVGDNPSPWNDETVYLDMVNEAVCFGNLNATRNILVKWMAEPELAAKEVGEAEEKWRKRKILDALRGDQLI